MKRTDKRRSGYRLAVFLLLVGTGVPGIGGGREGLASAGLSSGTGQSGSPAPAADSRFAIRWLPDATGAARVIVEVTGLDASSLARLRRSRWGLSEWQRLLAVTIQPDGQAVSQTNVRIDRKLPPLVGTYHVRADGLRFESQFAAEPGMTYGAVFLPDRLPTAGGRQGEQVSSVYRFAPRTSTSTTRVAQIYPTSDFLPENLLKFYVTFSAPMSRGQIYDHIHLRNSAGKPIELPFLEIDEELWDPAMMRLTLFLDPGRIKRGVLPLEEIGPALEEGKAYTLVIDRAWKDGEGNPLAESFQKSFRVGPPDRNPPDPAHWKIQAPKAGAGDAVTITFPEPMDYALSQRLISILDESGRVVPGQVLLTDQERRWAFTAAGSWRPGTYQLVIQTTIEDLAGNNIGKPFDVDLFESVSKRLSTSTVKKAFEIR